VCDVLERNARAGYHVHGAVWGIKTRFLSKLLIFFYTFDEKTVVLEKARIGIQIAE
jgi:hypothetical protein